MRSRIIGIATALAVAGGLAGCAPGPGGYAGWSHYRQQQANQHAYQAQRDAEAARWHAAHGNYQAAQQAQAAANAEARQAQGEHAHAQRDQWLSQFQLH